MDQNCDGASDFDADEDGHDSTIYPNRSNQTGDDCDDTNPDVRPGVLEECTTLYDDNCDGDTNDLNASTCTSYWQDFDADTYGEEGSQARCYCEPKINVSANEYYRALNDDDCNDNDYYANPGVKEYCDGHDDDCDGQVDEDDAEDASTWYQDSDNDSYGNASSTTKACSVPSGYVADDTDCDDNESTTYPGAPEFCDGVNNDCDNETDEDSSVDVLTWYEDGDSDGFGDSSSTDIDCYQPNGYVSNDTDCDDTEATTYPGADEYCDGVNNDCDNETDEDDAVDASTWYRDSDRDGYGTTNTTKTQCYKPNGYVSISTDCDDSNKNINPGATEICDSANNDEDCDGGADDNDPQGTPNSGTTNYYVDGDNDGYGDENASPTAYCDDPSNGTVANNSDCDDSDSNINPDGTEVCDSANDDEDCDGGADDNDPEGPVSGGTFYYIDSDTDGYGCDSCSGLRVCDSAPSNYVTDDTDCDDSSSSVNPGAAETACDGLDSDCDSNDSAYDITDLSQGDLLITEVMFNPSQVQDGKGEWFEIYNAGTESVDLDGLDLESDNNNGDSVDFCLGISPGEYLLFVANNTSSQNGGINGDFDYNQSDLILANNSDALRIVSGSTTIDEVAWDNGATFPDPNGASIALHINNYNTTINDIGTVWCEGTSTYGDGDLGTPGAVNDSCGESMDTDVQPLLNSNCTSCHSGSSPSFGLDWSSGNAWDSSYLVNSSHNSSYNIVEPGDADNSWMIIKLEGDQGSGNGDQMPKGGTPLSKADIDTIRDWIDDGAWK
jgi:hypothetical protein